MEPFEVLSHTADTAIIVRGRSIEELFANAGRAFFGLMFDMDNARGTGLVRISVEGEGLADLLVSWLSELLAVFEVEGRVLVDFEVTVVGDREITASARSVALDELPLIGTPIKAVTYHGLTVGRRDDWWEATIVFDV